ncbi:MAG TPA: DUF6020 family protein, partial [Sporolactobacillaceae bacterium]|nr:DUF6020 family protein [Sporolactobacillaceae bacterium]
YFLAYYPAKMNADSFWQWAMAHKVTPYNDWHPVLHTWMIQATMGIYNSPASYIILQIVIMALVISYALFSFQKLGLPLWLAIVIDLFYALNPVNGFLAITMWKDIPFSASILLLTVLLIKMANDHDWIKKRSHVIGFVIVCFFASNLRSNGFEVVLASLLITVALLKGVRRRLLFLMVPILVLQFTFIGPVMSYFSVIKPPLNEALAIPSQQIAATYKYHGKFTPQLRAYFDQILPAKKWRKDYIPYNVNPIKWDKHYNAEVITANFPHYLSNWASLMMLNPKIFVRAYMKQVAVIWQFTTPKGIKPYLVTPINLQQYPAYVKMRAPKYSIHLPYNKMVKASYEYNNQFLRSHGRKALTFAEYQARLKQTFEPLKTTPASKQLRKTMDKLLNHTRFNWKNYFVKGAIPLFFMLLSLVAAISRYKRRGWMVYLPAIFVILTMAMAIPATDFRYSYGFAFSVPFLLIYPKLRNKNREENAAGEVL